MGRAIPGSLCKPCHNCQPLPINQLQFNWLAKLPTGTRMLRMDKAFPDGFMLGPSTGFEEWEKGHSTI